MGFRVGTYARVWSIENKGKYSQGRISISRKNKTTDTYETDFQDGYVRFVGEAHTKITSVAIPEKVGVSIMITNCDVTNVYRGENGQVNYTPHYTIFGLEFPDNNSNTKGNDNTTSASSSGQDNVESFMSIPDGIDEELPFS